jgi:nucleotide-binding universal stress UspA family protein
MKERFGRILVPVIGREVDKEALQLACGIAKDNKSKVDVVYVIEVKRSLPLDAELEPEIQKAEETLKRAEDIADVEEWEVETDLLQARDVGLAIVDEAMERESDLIVIGVDYKRRFGEFHLGHSAPYVLKNAPCHVLLLRQPAS